MAKNITCISEILISHEGIVEDNFRARVLAVEDKVIRKDGSRNVGSPYLKLTIGPCEDDVEDPEELSDYDGRKKFTVIAVGPAYYFAKECYSVGEKYIFPAGTFKAEKRLKEFRSWSTEDFNLWFIPLDMLLSSSFLMKTIQILMA